MSGDGWTERDLEWSGLGLIGVIFHNLLGGTEEIHEKAQIAGVLSEIRIDGILVQIRRVIPWDKLLCGSGTFSACLKAAGHVLSYKS